jgi:hypothetical protein
VTKHKHKNKGRLPPFVPLHIATMETLAWKNLSMGARVLYAQIKRHHFVGVRNNNGRIYLSHRDAMIEMGVTTRHSIARWFRELQHYGFIVLIEPGCLGVDGKGKAPQWRLTELPTLTERETQDYLKWDGTPFNGNQAWRGQGRKLIRKKQNPGAETTARVVPKQPPLVVPKQPPLQPPSGAETTAISAGQGGAETDTISRITTPGGWAGSNVTNGQQQKTGRADEARPARDVIDVRSQPG